MYRGSIENWGDTRFLATTRHSSFAMDTHGKGANPVDALLAALCGCLGHYVRDFFREQSLPLAGFAMTAESAATPDQSRLASITVRIDLGEADLDPARRPALVAYVQRCKLYGTLRNGCPIDIALERREEPASEVHASPA